MSGQKVGYQNLKGKCQKFAPAPSKTALKGLAKDDEIVILTAEKGNPTVVMNMADYKEIVNMLVKSNTYKCLKKIQPSLRRESH